MTEQNEPAEPEITITDGAAQAPEPAPTEPDKTDKTDKTAEEHEELPEGVRKRIARANRQRDDARREAETTDARLRELQAITDKLREKAGKALDPADFESLDAFNAAKKEEEAKPEAPRFSEAAIAEIVEARGDLQELIEAADPKLWAEAIRQDDKGEPVYGGFTANVVLALADLGEDSDPAPAMRALLAMTEDERTELASGSRRAVRRAIRALAKKTPDVVIEDAKPRDPATGQFRKQSAAPPPIDPVSSGVPTERALSKLATEKFADEYIARRKAETANRGPMDW